MSSFPPSTLLITFRKLPASWKGGKIFLPGGLTNFTAVVICMHVRGRSVVVEHAGLSSRRSRVRVPSLPLLNESAWEIPGAFRVCRIDPAALAVFPFSPASS